MTTETLGAQEPNPVPTVARTKDAVQDTVRYDPATWRICQLLNQGKSEDELRHELRRKRDHLNRWMREAKHALRNGNSCDIPTSAPILGFHLPFPSLLEMHAVSDGQLERAVAKQLEALQLSVRLKARNATDNRKLLDYDFTLAQAKGAGITHLDDFPEVKERSNDLRKFRKHRKQNRLEISQLAAKSEKPTT